MATGKRSFPVRRAAAEQNRDRVVAAARAAFAEGDTGVSMAEVARRAGVGMATVYRNFRGRRELLEALYAAEVDIICRAAVIEDGQTPGEALTAWLRLQFDFIPHKRPIVSELLEHSDEDGIPSRRAQAIEAGRPLLAAAQEAGEIHGAPEYLEPIIQTMLDGLQRRSPTTPTDRADPLANGIKR